MSLDGALRSVRLPAASAGILHVAFNDIAWQLLPLGLRFGSGQTYCRRLGRWQRAEVLDQPHPTLITELNAAGELDWSRVSTAPPSAREEGEPTPVFRRSTGGRLSAGIT